MSVWMPTEVQTPEPTETAVARTTGPPRIPVRVRARRWYVANAADLRMLGLLTILGVCVWAWFLAE